MQYDTLLGLRPGREAQLRALYERACGLDGKLYITPATEDLRACPEEVVAIQERSSRENGQAQHVGLYTALIVAQWVTGEPRSCWICPATNVVQLSGTQ